MKFFSASGGLIYHARAWRYKDRLWAPFRDNIHGFLEAWKPPERELVIFGPSGGYTLKTEFLKRFDSICLVDLDPLAPHLFRWSHPDLPLRTIARDLIFANGRFEITKMRLFLASQPKAAILFSNLLGQLPLYNSDQKQFEAWFGELEVLLRGRSWASYHDLFSFAGEGKTPDSILGPVESQVIRLVKEEKRDAEIVDHGTSGLFPAGTVHWAWKLSPTQTHIVGGYYRRRAGVDEAEA